MAGGPPRVGGTAGQDGASARAPVGARQASRGGARTGWAGLCLGWDTAFHRGGIGPGALGSGGVGRWQGAGRQGCPRRLPAALEHLPGAGGAPAGGGTRCSAAGVRRCRCRGKGWRRQKLGCSRARRCLYPPHCGKPHRLLTAAAARLPRPEAGLPPWGAWMVLAPCPPNATRRSARLVLGISRTAVPSAWGWCRPWWQHPILQAPTMSSQLLLLAVLPALLGPPAAMAQKRSQGGC